MHETYIGAEEDGKMKWKWHWACICIGVISLILDAIFLVSILFWLIGFGLLSILPSFVVGLATFAFQYLGIKSFYDKYKQRHSEHSKEMARGLESISLGETFTRERISRPYPLVLGKNTGNTLDDKSYCIGQMNQEQRYTIAHLKSGGYEKIQKILSRLESSIVSYNKSLDDTELATEKKRQVMLIYDEFNNERNLIAHSIRKEDTIAGICEDCPIFFGG